jgi:hypothetical protein
MMIPSWRAHARDRTTRPVVCSRAESSRWAARSTPLLHSFFRVVSTRRKVIESWTWWRRLLPMDSRNERRSSNIITVVDGNRRKQTRLCDNVVYDELTQRLQHVQNH